MWVGFGGSNTSRVSIKLADWSKFLDSYIYVIIKDNWVINIKIRTLSLGFEKWRKIIKHF